MAIEVEGKKTDMEILRNSMFDEISRLKRGTTTVEDALAVCKLGNLIVSTYNTEIKAIDTMCRVQELGADVPDIKIFKEEKCVSFVEK